MGDPQGVHQGSLEQLGTPGQPQPGASVTSLGMGTAQDQAKPSAHGGGLSPVPG